MQAPAPSTSTTQQANCFRRVQTNSVGLDLANPFTSSLELVFQGVSIIGMVWYEYFWYKELHRECLN